MKRADKLILNASYRAALEGATQLLKVLPQRPLAPTTEVRYRKEFARMMKEPDLDPLRPDDQKRTYYYRRAAMFFAGAEALREARNQVFRALARRDQAACLVAIEDLKRLVDRLGPAIERDRPEKEPQAHLKEGITSRWVAPKIPKPAGDTTQPKRRPGSKRRLLKQLPRDWQDTFWNHVKDNPKLARAAAVEILIGCRPVELTVRPKAVGVLAEVAEGGALTLLLAGAKVRQNTGQPHRSITLDPEEAGAPARYLAQEVQATEGKLNVRVGSTRTWHRQVSRVGKILFPNLGEPLTPIVFRHQLVADLKVTYGAGEMVAAAAGHISDVSQQHYGRHHHGRGRRGILHIKASRPVRTVAVPRAALLASRSAPGLRR